MAIRLGCSSRLLGAVAAHTFIRSSTTNGIGNAANPSISYVAQRSLSDGKEKVRARRDRQLCPSELLHQDMQRSIRRMRKYKPYTPQEPSLAWAAVLFGVSIFGTNLCIAKLLTEAEEHGELDCLDVAIGAGLAIGLGGAR